MDAIYSVAGAWARVCGAPATWEPRREDGTRAALQLCYGRRRLRASPSSKFAYWAELTPPWPFQPAEN